MTNRALDRALASLLGGDPAGWSGCPDRWSEADLLRAADWHGVTALLAHLLRTTSIGAACPESIRAGLKARAVRHVGADMARTVELTRVLDALHAAGAARPIVFKGAALAYTAYPDPSLRKRNDTDLLIPAADVSGVTRALESLGYTRNVPLGAGAAIGQALFTGRDRHGLEHAVDVHWQINNRPRLAEWVSYEDLSVRARPVPGLHAHVLAPDAVDALLIAAVHRATHHPGSGHLAWLYDIVLLVRELGEAGRAEFQGRASKRRVSAVCRASLFAAVAELGAPAEVREWLGQWDADASAQAGNEPSAMYAGRAATFGDVALSDFATQQGWAARAQYLRTVLFPDAAYMMSRYGVSRRAWLPFFHARRIVAGSWHLAGRMATGVRQGHRV